MCHTTVKRSSLAAVAFVTKKTNYQALLVTGDGPLYQMIINAEYAYVRFGREYGGWHQSDRALTQTNMIACACWRRSGRSDRAAPGFVGKMFSIDSDTLIQHWHQVQHPPAHRTITTRQTSDQ